MTTVAKTQLLLAAGWESVRYAALLTARGAGRFGKGRGQGDVAGSESVNLQPRAYTYTNTGA